MAKVCRVEQVVHIKWVVGQGLPRGVHVGQRALLQPIYLALIHHFRKGRASQACVFHGNCTRFQIKHTSGHISLSSYQKEVSWVGLSMKGSTLHHSQAMGQKSHPGFCVLGLPGIGFTIQVLATLKSFDLISMICISS